MPDIVEIIIDLTNGENYTLLATCRETPIGIQNIPTIEHKIFALYTEDEFVRKGPEVLKTCFCFFMPDSDLRPEIISGCLTFKKGEQIIFMEPRQNIKKIKVGMDGHYIDLCDIK